MFLEIREPGEGFIAELALVGGVLGGAEREGRLGVGVGGVGRGGRGRRRRRRLRRRWRPGAARRATHAAQRLWSQTNKIKLTYVSSSCFFIEGPSMLSNQLHQNPVKELNLVIFIFLALNC